MKFRIVIGSGLALLLFGTGAAFAFSEPAKARSDSLKISPEYVWQTKPNPKLLRPPTTGGVRMTLTQTIPYQSPRVDLLLRPELSVSSRFAHTVHGADAGAYLGLSIGFLGNLVQVWDEKTAWYLMGAGAAIGALWNGATDGRDFDPGEPNR